MLPDRPLPPGPARIDCPCGDEKCGLFGVARKNGHVRGCRCRRCLGGRNREAGLRKQRAARKRAGVPLGRYWGELGNEEQWKGYFRVEVKSGSQVQPVATRFLQAEDQSEAARSLGDTRPFMFIAMPKDWGTEGLVVLRLTDWEQHIAPRLSEDVA